MVLGVRLLKSENCVKMLSCYFSLPLESVINMCKKTESQSRTTFLTNSIFYRLSLYFWSTRISCNRKGSIVCSWCSQQKRHGWASLKTLLLFATSTQECTGGALAFWHCLTLRMDATFDSATGQGCKMTFAPRGQQLWELGMNEWLYFEKLSERRSVQEPISSDT